MSLESKQRQIAALIPRVAASTLDSRAKGIACAYLTRMVEDSDYYQSVVGIYEKYDDADDINYMFRWLAVQTSIEPLWSNVRSVLLSKEENVLYEEDDEYEDWEDDDLGF